MVDTRVAYLRLAEYFTPVPSTFSERILTFSPIRAPSLEGNRHEESVRTTEARVVSTLR